MNGDAELVALIQAVRAGERRALAKAITLVESERAEDRRRAAVLLPQLAPSNPTALRLGFTGPPGVGKSTLLDACGSCAIRAGHRVSVLAIDPSSAKSGGSLLGDRTRMARLSTAPEAFVRPSPASGASGGIGRRTREALIVLEAGGYDLAFVESVGVGQGELAITDVVDVLVVLLMAGAGDDVQSIKRGIMEHADIVVFSKADGENQAASCAARDQLAALLSFLHRDAPPVLALSAFVESDSQQLYRAIFERKAALEASGELALRRQVRRRAWFHAALNEALNERLESVPELSAERARLEGLVDRGELLPPQAAQQLVEKF